MWEEKAEERGGDREMVDLQPEASSGIDVGGKVTLDRQGKPRPSEEGRKASSSRDLGTKKEILANLNRARRKREASGR